jgi:hypothetical protein
MYDTTDVPRPNAPSKRITDAPISSDADPFTQIRPSRDPAALPIRQTCAPELPAHHITTDATLTRLGNQNSDTERGLTHDNTVRWQDSHSSERLTINTETTLTTLKVCCTVAAARLPC